MTTKDTVKKPKCTLVGKNGDVFNLIGLASRALKNAGQNDQAQEMSNRVFLCQGYDEALAIICEYVDAR